MPYYKWLDINYRLCNSVKFINVYLYEKEKEKEQEKVVPSWLWDGTKDGTRMEERLREKVWQTKMELGVHYKF